MIIFIYFLILLLLWDGGIDKQLTIWFGSMTQLESISFLHLKCLCSISFSQRHHIQIYLKQNIIITIILQINVCNLRKLYQMNFLFQDSNYLQPYQKKSGRTKTFTIYYVLFSVYMLYLCCVVFVKLFHFSSILLVFKWMYFVGVLLLI